VKGKAIGQGGFGRVFMGTYRGRQVAIKEMLEQELMNDDDWATFKKEVEILETFHHELIVEFIGAILIPGRLSIVMEYCPYGSLQNAMKKYPNEFDDFRLKMKCLLDASSVMEFLHSCNYVHRDLKTDNFLVVSLDPTLPVLKLTDFGTTRTLRKTRVELNMTKGVGTRAFMAPEILKGSQTYDFSVDVFSFSVVIYCVLTKKLPYEDDTSFKNDWDFSNAIIAGKRPVIPDSCHPELRKLADKCWSGNPSRRPSFHEIHSTLEKILAEHKQKDLGEQQASSLAARDPEQEKKMLSFRKKAAKLLKEKPDIATDDSLQWNNGSGSDFKQLCLLLKGNAIPLNKLAFSSTEDSEKIGLSGAKMLSEALRTNTTLTELYLNDSHIEAEGATKICESLKKNSSLTRLSLSKNWIGDVGIKKICESLLQNDKLTALNLSENTITMEGSTAICKYLTASTSLTELNLASNLIGDSGTVILCASLQKNRLLTRLNLEDNEIGSEGAKELYGLLSVNTILTELDLRRNWIKGDAMQALLEGWGPRDPSNLRVTIERESSL